MLIRVLLAGVLYLLIIPLALYAKCVTPKYDLVICAVFQNESFFLKEWLEFHKLIGVQHFYLYDNLSTDNYLEILLPYIESGEVDLFHWPVETCNQQEYLDLLQLPVYNDALNIVKQSARWAAFIDLDEFLFPVRQTNLLMVLDEYRAYGALAVNWQVFGTSGIERLREGELIIENLLWRTPCNWGINKIVKMVVQPHHVHMFSHPHYCDFEEGYFAVNSNKERLPDLCGEQDPIVDVLRINHYWFGDRNWFVTNKLLRRKKWGIPIINDALDNFIDSFNQIEDKTILRFISELRDRINEKP